MDFASHTISGLKYLGDSNITSQNFKRIVDSVLLLILEEENLERVGKICPEKREIVEQAYAALLALVVHAAQIDADEETLKEYLTGVCGLKEDRLQYLTSAFSEKQRDISDKLGRIKALPPSLIDVNWRLDYVIKSSTRSHIGEAIYLLVLTTQQGGAIKHIRFTCDHAQLQDLSTRLKEIVHQVEAFATS